MESTVSAILGEFAARSMSFLVDKYLKQTAAPTEEESMSSLQRLLLRVRVIVEEADERHITNQAMLHQFSMLKKEMYRGYYTLDTCICRGAGHEAARDDQVSGFALPESNPAKRVCFHSGSSQSVKELQQVLRSLEAIITDVNEFVVFLGSCPRRYRQPYSVYLILDRCMFGRQMEMKRVMSFLLQPGSPGRRRPCVLPIIGPLRVGKSTLVQHACNDERVRAHFSRIVLFNQGDLEDGNIEETLRTIVTSRSEKIAGFGSTELPLKLEFLTQEAYWYLVKAYAFGSTDAADHPTLASIAMEISRECGGCFVAANIFTRLLRSNPSHRFGSSVLAAIKKLKQNHFMYTTADHQEPTVRNPSIAECFAVLDDYQAPDSAHSSQASQAPKLSVLDVLFGSARPRGRFEALAWKSQIPPHYSYIYSCEIRRPKRKVVRNKRIVG